MDLARTTRYALIFIFSFYSSLVWSEILHVDLSVAPESVDIEAFLPEPVDIGHTTIIADKQSEYVLQEIIGSVPFILDQALLKKVIYYAGLTKRFAHIKFSIQGSELQITPEKAWLFDRVRINGLMFGKDAFKRLYLLNAGDHFDLKRHTSSCQNILTSLHAQGYFLAQVKDTIIYDHVRKSVVIDLTIIFNDQFTINKVQVVSADFIDDACLQAFVKKTYNKELFDAACQNLKKCLMCDGYYPLTFTIKNTVNHDSKTVDIYIDIKLSEQRIMLFHGNYYLTDQQLFDAILGLGKSAWIIPPELLADLIVQEYKRNGFENVKVNSHIKDGVCVFSIQEGKKVKEALVPFSLPSVQIEPLVKKFGATIIQNLSTIPSSCIERELLYNQNDEWDSDLVRQTIKNLNNLQVFDQVSLVNVFDPCDPDRATMLLKVHNDLPYELRLKGGIGLQQMSKDFVFKGVSYVAGGSFLYKNPFNRADLFSVDADYTFGEQNLAIRYTYPWLFNMRMRSYVEIYVNQYLQPGLRHNHKNIYSFVQQGFLLGTHYEHGSLDSQCNIGLEWMKTNIVDKRDNPLFNQEITHALYFQPLLVDKKIPYVLLEPQMVINTTDDKLNPTSGQLSLVSCKAMIPWRRLSFNSFFMKFLFDHSIYVPIKTMVCAVRARAGHIFYKEFKNVMPAERFYLGGANSIRSYETDMCPPLGAIVNEQGKTCFIPQGARSMINFNAELRIPASHGLWIALFQDLGALSNNHFADIKAHDILAGSGFGIRYQTPIGPLRFDVAFKWRRPDPRIPGYCWFLSFGNAF